MYDRRRTQEAFDVTCYNIVWYIKLDNKHQQNNAKDGQIALKEEHEQKTTSAAVRYLI